jgi:HEAT repeat protein
MLDRAATLCFGAAISLLLPSSGCKRRGPVPPREPERVETAEAGGAEDRTTAAVGRLSRHIDTVVFTITLVPDCLGAGDPGPVPRTVILHVPSLEAELHPARAHAKPISAGCMISTGQAGKLIDALAESGFFEKAGSAPYFLTGCGESRCITRVIAQDGDWYSSYTATFARGPQLESHLGAVRSATENEAGPLIDQLLTQVRAYSHRPVERTQVTARHKNVGSHTTTSREARPIPAVAARVELLNAPDPKLRRIAAESLGNIWDIGTFHRFPALRDAIRDDAEMRQRFFGIYGGLRYASASSALARAFADADEGVRWRAAIALGKLRDRSTTPLLIEGLSDIDSTVRSCAASALGRLGDESAVPALIEATKDEWVVAFRAAGALGKLGDRSAARALIGMLAHPRSVVRGSAATALGELGDRAAVPALIAALRKEKPVPRDYSAALALIEAVGKLRVREALPLLVGHMESELWHIRCRTVVALGKIGDPEAVPLVARALRDPAQHVQWRAALALGLIRDPSAVPALVDVLRDDRWGSRSWAAAALYRIGDPAGLEAVQEAIGRDPGIAPTENRMARVGGREPPVPWERTRAAAAEWLDAMTGTHAESRRAALMRLEGKAAVPVLVAATQRDEDASVRECAAQRLGEFGESLDVPLVSDALADPSPAVRSGAAQALGRLGGEAARQALRDALERERDGKVRQSIGWGCPASVGNGQPT